MAADELVEDPVLRQRYRLTVDGDVLRNELWAEPGSEVPEHYHPRLEERFEVLEGDFVFKVAGRERAAGPGERLVVNPGVRHSFRNAGDGVGRLVAELEPAMTMRGFFEDSAAMARAGKYTARGLPTGPGAFLDTADFVERYRDVTVMTFPPLPVQRVLFPPLARLARRLRAR